MRPHNGKNGKEKCLLFVVVVACLLDLRGEGCGNIYSVCVCVCVCVCTIVGHMVMLFILPYVFSAHGECLLRAVGFEKPVLLQIVPETNGGYKPPIVYSSITFAHAPLSSHSSMLN